MAQNAGDAAKAGPKLTDKQKKKLEKALLLEMQERKTPLQIQITKQRKRIAREIALISKFQQEREKINFNWIIQKKLLEERKSEQLNKVSQIEELKEHHIMQLNQMKQKVKHLQFQHQDKQTDLKKDVEKTLKNIEEQHQIQSKELKADNRYLRITQKENELSHNEFMNALQFDNIKKQTAIRQEYERVFNQIKEKYKQKMDKLRLDMEDKRKFDTEAIEKKKDDHIERVTMEHIQKYTKIKNYYQDIITNNINIIKLKKNEILNLQQAEQNDKIKLDVARKKVRGIQDPLDNLKAQIEKYEEQKKQVKPLNDEVKKRKEDVDILEEKLKQKAYEYEVKYQDYQYLVRERDMMKQKHYDSLFTVQQKIGLENLIMEKKLSTIKEEIEQKDVEINQVINACNLQPEDEENMTNLLEEIETMKNDIIQQLQEKLNNISKAHAHMVKAYEGKLSEFLIPVEELGFDPLVPNNAE